MEPPLPGAHTVTANKHKHGEEEGAWVALIAAQNEGWNSSPCLRATVYRLRSAKVAPLTLDLDLLTVDACRPEGVWDLAGAGAGLARSVVAAWAECPSGASHAQAAVRRIQPPPPVVEQLVRAVESAVGMGAPPSMWRHDLYVRAPWGSKASCEELGTCAVLAPAHRPATDSSATLHTATVPRHKAALTQSNP